jgi:hypothetical protein
MGPEDDAMMPLGDEAIVFVTNHRRPQERCRGDCGICEWAARNLRPRNFAGVRIGTLTQDGSMVIGPVAA